MKLLPKSFFLQLTLVQLAVVGGILAVQLLLFCFAWNLIEQHTLQGTYWDIAEEVATELDSMPATGPEEIHQLLSSYAIANPEIKLFLLDSKGNVTANSEKETIPFGTSVSLQPVERFLSSGGGYPLLIKGLDPVSLERRAIAAARRRSAGYVYVILPASVVSFLSLMRAAASPGHPAYLIWVLLLSCCSLIVVILLLRTTRGFRSSIPVVRKFALGQFDVKIDCRSSGEIGEHLNVLNRMAEQIAVNMRALEERNQLQSELVTNISHDLRTPVTLISGYGEQLVEFEKLDPERRRKSVETIRANADALKARIFALSELAALEERREPLQLETVDFEELARAVLSAFQEEGAARKLSLKVCEAAALPKVAADRQLLSRALANLIENALRYTPAGGAIEVGAANAPGGLRCFVRNSGPPIEVNDLERIFQRRYQGEDRPGVERGAAGLGLSIVRAIIEAHGSTIRVGATADGETEFEFLLLAA